VLLADAKTLAKGANIGYPRGEGSEIFVIDGPSAKTAARLHSPRGTCIAAGRSVRPEVRSIDYSGGCITIDVPPPLPRYIAQADVTVSCRNFGKRRSGLCRGRNTNSSDNGGCNGKPSLSLSLSLSFRIANSLVVTYPAVRYSPPFRPHVIPRIAGSSAINYVRGPPWGARRPRGRYTR